jgi:hypothetical protein
MMVRSSRENFERILSALAELGADVSTATVGDLELNTQWETLSGSLDILLTAVGPNETVITFNDLDRNAEVIEVEKGLLVRTASLDDVIRMKDAADRTKDTGHCLSCGGCEATIARSSLVGSTHSRTSRSMLTRKTRSSYSERALSTFQSDTEADFAACSCRDATRPFRHSKNSSGMPNPNSEHPPLRLTS